MTRLKLKNFGQIRDAEVAFGDLTVLVGPQATGKSLFLQLLKLIIDKKSIHSELRMRNVIWDGDPEAFLNLYFGDGMHSIWNKKTIVQVDSKKRELNFFARPYASATAEELFFIPAQRVMSLKEGMTQTFSDFRAGDPYCLRSFADTLHNLVQNEFAQLETLFPVSGRLNEAFREPIEKNIFGKFHLQTDSEKYQRRIVLRTEERDPLPFLVWSAGQREFVPLLLGLYWLMPSGKMTKRDSVSWVVIEEPEMGLHPNAISTVMSLVLELLARGYRVTISTHSPQVLDVVWALQFFKQNGGTVKDVLNIFELKNNAKTKEVGTAALTKDFKVYFFGTDGIVRDISNLDPGADNETESGWGGLSGFSGHVGDIVSAVAKRAQRAEE
ncbi:AAA family ATPase [Leptonema illini]|uniref:ATPase AAA-type core domain-containing protein n=1 Tax=Leptonema illini DSM 21528 TaxID=929563 RepID=H2CDC7_9LEPT|nr:ATP-binding protein [Leptonema illini]EHQ05431.1 hypothetical protein Lepil_0730 [Leptonema illini DSM 21528]